MNSETLRLSAGEELAALIEERENIVLKKKLRIKEFNNQIAEIDMAIAHKAMNIRSGQNELFEGNDYGK